MNQENKLFNDFMQERKKMHDLITEKEKIMCADLSQELKSNQELKNRVNELSQIDIQREENAQNMKIQEQQNYIDQLENQFKELSHDFQKIQRYEQQLNEGLKEHKALQQNIKELEALQGLYDQLDIKLPTNILEENSYIYAFYRRDDGICKAIYKKQEHQQKFQQINHLWSEIDRIDQMDYPQDL